MQEQSNHGHLPNRDRISTVSAAILLAYTLERFISLPGREFSAQLPGFYFDINLNIQTLVALLTAGLTASGADWLLREHPFLKKQRTLEHWLLPAMTALVIAMPLFQIPRHPIWWFGFAVGGGLIILVIIAEYITINPQDPRYPLAAAGITAISFALFLILVTTLRLAETRLFLLLPAITISSMLVSLRMLRLRFHNRWLMVESFTIAMITAQVAAGLHYFPLSPVAYGLAILAPAYALINFLVNLAQVESFLRVVLEPTLLLILIWMAAFLLRI